MNSPAIQCTAPYFNKLLVSIAAGIGLGFTANAATLATNFDSLTTPALPSGWSAIGSGITTAANGNPTNNLEVAAGTTRYLVNSGTGLDARSDFSGTFDFRLGGADDFYDNISFWVGDLSSGLTTTAGDHFRVDLKRATFNRRASIYDATGNADENKLVNGDGNNAYSVSSNTWYSADFSWTASTGTFAINWDNGNSTDLSFSGYSFNDNEVYFGFGTIQEEGRFDNINITGTSYVVPEPSTALLGLIGLCLLLRRRR